MLSDAFWREERKAFLEKPWPSCSVLRVRLERYRDYRVAKSSGGSGMTNASTALRGFGPVYQKDHAGRDRCASRISIDAMWLVVFASAKLGVVVTIKCHVGAGTTNRLSKVECAQDGALHSSYNFCVSIVAIHNLARLGYQLFIDKNQLFGDERGQLAKAVVSGCSTVMRWVGCLSGEKPCGRAACWSRICWS